jgi:hypothetical protein
VLPFGVISPAGALLAGLVLMAVPQDPTVPAAGDPEPMPVGYRPLRVELGAGYDFFSHSYTMLNTDTTSTLSEGNGTLNVSWAPWLSSGSTLQLGNRLFLGSQYTHNVLTGYWNSGYGPGFSWTADTRWEMKRHFVDGLAFSNDHNGLYGSLRGSYRWSQQWSLRARLRGEVFDYSEHTEFFYDTRTWSGAVSVRGGGWLGPWWQIEMGGGNQAVPDSTMLDSGDRNARLDLGWTFENGGEVDAAVVRRERDYSENGPRPDRALTGVRIAGRSAPFSTWGGWVDLRLDRTAYARQTLVYNDGTELRVSGGPAWHPSALWEVRLGGGYLWHRTKAFADTSYTDLFGVTQLVDSYSQPFIFAEANVIGTSGLWAFLTLEIGQRNYVSETDWDSDFLYVDLMATAEIPLVSGIALQALINLTPERHREPEDNSVTNYTSVDLIWRFR